MRGELAGLLLVSWLTVAWLLLAWVATALHELGHLACLRAVGGRLRLLVIGLGPGARLEGPGWAMAVGLLPFFGCCVGAGLPPGRWRRAVYLLGGPAANAAAAAAAWLGARSLGEDSLPALALWGGALINAWEAVGNLLPQPGLQADSDGRQLLALWQRLPPGR